jgi:hypothetical protein
MKDYAIMGVQKIDTSKPYYKGWFGLRKIFWDYLRKLHVAFYDPCCADAGEENKTTLRFDIATGETEYYDPETDSWIPVADWAAPSTTSTTTAASTTTTTTAASTTTTTTV